MEIKLKDGKTFKVKNISLDERDELLDGVVYKYNEDGTLQGVNMMHSTMTKWLRICLDGDTSDETLMKMTLEEKSKIFTELQTMFFMGEKKASK